MSQIQMYKLQIQATKMLQIQATKIYQIQATKMYQISATKMYQISATKMYQISATKIYQIQATWTMKFLKAMKFQKAMKYQKAMIFQTLILTNIKIKLQNFKNKWNQLKGDQQLSNEVQQVVKISSMVSRPQSQNFFNPLKTFIWMFQSFVEV